MKLVITQFVLHPQQDQQTTGYSDRETDDVDEGVSLVSPDVPNRDFKIVFDHDDTPMSSIPEKMGNGFEYLGPIPKFGNKRTRCLINLEIFLLKITRGCEIPKIRVDLSQDPFCQFGRILEFFISHSSFFNDLVRIPLHTLSEIVLISINAMMPAGVSL
jgi:hypothetical protein